jgi:hypothetical protein
MKKHQLDTARRAMQSKLDVATLATRVRADLAPVASAYDTTQLLMEKVALLLANAEHADRPAQEIRLLAGALKDGIAALTALREEARTTVAIHAANAHAANVPELPAAPQAEPAAPQAQTSRSLHQDVEPTDVER